MLLCFTVRKMQMIAQNGMGIPGGLPQWSVIDPSAILRMTESLIIVHFL